MEIEQLWTQESINVSSFEDDMIVCISDPINVHQDTPVAYKHLKNFRKIKKKSLDLLYSNDT